MSSIITPNNIGAYIGVGGKAQYALDLCVGVGGVARRVSKAYIGDADGKARPFYQAPGVITPSNMTSNAAPAPYRVSSQNYVAGYEAYIAFSALTGVDSAAACGEGEVIKGTDTLQGGDWWLQIDLGEARFADRGRLKSCNSKSSTGYTNSWEDPRDFQILGSNDAAAWNTASGADKWEVLGGVTDYIIGKSDHAWQAPFVLDSPGFYHYYRLRVTGTSYATSGSGSQFLMVDKLELSAS